MPKTIPKGIAAEICGKIVRPAAFVAACLAVFPAAGEALSERLALDPKVFEFGGIEIQPGGSLQGAVFGSSKDGEPSASALAAANLRVRKIFDNGMVLGGRGDFLLYRDGLSSDNYGGDTVQKLYLYLQTGFGRLDIGEQDGAAASLGLRGPVVDSKINLADRGITFFRDSRTGSSLAGLHAPMIGIAASSNYAKFNYTTPRLLGVQAGFSFTPESLRAPLPFTGNSAGASGGQRNIIEAAGSYQGYFANSAFGISAGYVHGESRNAAPGFADLSEWSVGMQIAHTLPAMKLNFGGGYRRTNAYLLDIGQVSAGRETGIAHLGASAEWGSWIFGVEHSLSDADGPAKFRIRGVQLTAAYKLNANLQIGAGWQRFLDRRSTGTFGNGLQRLERDAAFLSLAYTL